MKKKAIYIVLLVVVALGIAAFFAVPPMLTKHYYSKALEQDEAKNFSEALALYEKVNTVDSWYRMADIYADSTITESYSPSLALTHYEKALEGGKPEAAYEIGRIYYEGLGVEPDTIKAISMFDLNAGDKEVSSKGTLALHFYNAKDTLNALKYGELAANLKDYEAMTKMGKMLIEWENVKDVERGLKYVTEAADSNYAKAAYNLSCYYSNPHYGIKTNQDKAFKYALQAAQADYVPAYNTVFWSYYAGEGTPKDINQALYWVNKGCEAEDAESYYYKGMLYYNGDGVAKDTKTGKELLAKAAEMGDTDAQAMLDKISGNAAARARAQAKRDKALKDAINSMNSATFLYQNGIYF